MADTKNLPADRTLNSEDAKHQEQAFGMVMVIVPLTFIAITILLCVVRIP